MTSCIKHERLWNRRTLKEITGEEAELLTAAQRTEPLPGGETGTSQDVKWKKCCVCIHKA